MQEFYADFVAVDPYHFTLNTPFNHVYMLPAVVDPSSLQNYCDRVVDGIAGIFLALKRRPVIRYQRTSDIAKRIAQESAVSITVFDSLKYNLHLHISLLFWAWVSLDNLFSSFFLGGGVVVRD